MTLLGTSPGLYTDFYELSMAQSYFLKNKHEEHAIFDYFFRKAPFQGGYTIFSGLEDLLNTIANFQYSSDDLAYLKQQGFHTDFLEYLASFHFSGNIYSVREGEIVFPNEPLLTVESNLVEAQLLETLILNFLNFQSLIATKARRIRHVAKDKFFADFGLRRAHSLGSIHASRAAFIGGTDATSNVLAGKYYNIPVTGTMAHSWIQSFDNELEAFQTYAEINKENTVLLLDTYDTLKSGLPNAIIVAKELSSKNYQLKGVRLDSGDLTYLSQKIRHELDAEGLDYVQIIASNQLNETIIKSLDEQNAKLNGFGVGTELITGQKDGALGGVYKLVENNGTPRLKISENIEKISLPCNKKLVRYFDEEGFFYRDGILQKEEAIATTIYHPFEYYKNTDVSSFKSEILTQTVIKNGERVSPIQTLQQIKTYSTRRFTQLRQAHKRLISPHIYKVGISKSILDTRDKMIQLIQTKLKD